MAKASDDRSADVLGVMILFLVLVWIAFPLRAWVRLRIIKNWGLDDWLILASLLLFTVYGGFVLYAVHWGTGKHVTALSPEALQKALMGWYYCEVWYILATACLKVAVGAFLLRVATLKAHRWTIYSLICINVVFNVYFFFSSVFQCAPVSHFWMRFSGQVTGSCVNPSMTADSTFAQSAISIVTDFTYAILPLFIVKDLQMGKQKRVGVAVVLGLGALASIATIVRVPYIVTLTQTQDFLFATVDVAIWSTVEPGIGILAVSLATLRPLLRSCLSRVGLRSTHNASQNSASNSRASMGLSKTLQMQSTSTRAATPGDLGANLRKKERQIRYSTSFYDDDADDFSDRPDIEKGGFELSPVSPAAYKTPDPALYHDLVGEETLGIPSLRHGDDALTPITEVHSRPDLDSVFKGYNRTPALRDISPMGNRSGHVRLASAEDIDGRRSRNRNRADDRGIHNMHTGGRGGSRQHMDWYDDDGGAGVDGGTFAFGTRNKM